MHIFISTGEPSGDLHAANLLHSFRKLDPNIQCSGFGGDRLRNAGAELLYPLAHLSVMWFPHVLKSYRTFCDLIRKADDHLREQRPDAVVVIDYPGFNWWIARCAKERGIPVFYFVPPQLWAWGAWRIKKMRRYIDHVLCSLPFEPNWYRERGMQTEYFGHPYFDELDRQSLDEQFMREQRTDGRPIVAVLPGSRRQEIRMNWPSIRRSMQLIQRKCSDVRFLIGAFNEEQARTIGSSLDPSISAEVFVGRTPEVIHLGHACISVSGSVGLELLHAAVPSVVIYRLRRIDLPFLWALKKSRFVAIVNLLADDELLPEFVRSSCPAAPMAEQVLRWLNQPLERKKTCDRLSQLRGRVAVPGACGRAAEFIHRVLYGDSSASVSSETQWKAAG